MSRLAVIDDHAVLVELLGMALRSKGHDVVAIEPGPFDALTAAVVAADPDLVVLDLSLGPDAPSGLELVPVLAGEGLLALVVTGETDQDVLARCLAEGAVGVVAKTAGFGSLLDNVNRVLSGERADPSLAVRSEWSRRVADLSGDGQRGADAAALTPRERIVLAALAAGRTAPEIAQVEYVAVSTVRSQIKSIFAKLGVSSQLAAVARGRELGLVGDDPRRLAG